MAAAFRVGPSGSEGGIEDGQHHQGQQGGGEDAADDHGGERPLDLGAHARVERHGQEAEGGHGGRHQHGPQAREGRLANGFTEGLAPLQELAHA